MQTQGRGSRQKIKVDCGNETTVTCHPTDCRLVRVTQNDEITDFFGATVKLTSYGNSKDCDVRKNNPRGQNSIQYVAIVGFAATDASEPEIKTVTVENEDPAELKDSIEATICSCIRTEIPPAPEPPEQNIADIQFVHDDGSGPAVIVTPQYEKYDGEDVYAFGVRFDKADPGIFNALSSVVYPAGFSQANVVEMNVKNINGNLFGTVQEVTGATTVGSVINFNATYTNDSAVTQGLPSGEIYELVIKYTL